MDLARKQYSGKHRRVVKGIDLANLLWTDGSKMVPVDYRIYDPSRDGKTKNDHGREMLSLAKKREFEPSYMLIDSWHASVNNLKAADSFGWKWIGEIKSNRLVNIKQGFYVRASDLDWTAKPVHKVWLKAYGRGIKQCCGIEHCYAVKERSQRNHILCAFLVFLKLEWERIQNAISWYEQKLSITRSAIAVYLA